MISKSDESKRERVLTFDEERRLLEVCTGERTITYTRQGKEVTAKIEGGREYLKSLVITAVDTAMRRGELLKLRWKDVNFEDRTITIIASNSKTLKAREVGMTDRICNEMNRLWKHSPKDKNELVFGITDNFKKSFSSACKDAQIEQLRFHDLRHTAITRMIQAGLAPMEIMKISGHTQMNTFARYVNPDTNAVQRIADRLSAFQTESMSNVSVHDELVN